MKKLLLLALVLVMGLGLVACGDEKEKPTTTGSSTDGGKDVALTCEFNVPNGGAKLVPGDKFDNVGETVSYSEGASCYYDGMDKVFGYNGYTVTTFPAAGGDYIADIYITGKDIKTPAGIGVGSTTEELTKAYGSKYEVDGKNYKYSIDSEKYVYFFMSNDAVKGYGYAKEVK